MTRRLRLRFENPDDFQREFDSNIAMGGAFLAGTGGLGLRDVVEIEIALAFNGQSRTLEAEVVHVSEGGGVAVQFLRAASEIRAEFAAMLSGAAEPSWPPELGSGSDAAKGESRRAAPATSGPTPIGRVERRRSARAQVRLPAQLEGSNARVEGVTRDLSETGALISADASELPPGKPVRLQLRNPETGDPVEVSGRISRHLEVPGTVAAVGVDFDVPEERKPELAALVRAAETVHQQRVAAGISGRIEELGMPNLIQMLGRSSPRGTLSVSSGTEEGALAFEAECLRYAHLGATRGIKALVRMLRWDTGTFEFHAQVDAFAVEDQPLQLEAALLEATRILDEAGTSLEPAQRFQVDRERLASSAGLAKTEEAVVDLATAGFTVRRILDVIPEADAQVSAALVSLIEQGILRPLR